MTPGTAAPPIRTPITTFRAAIRRYHREGLPSARATINGLGGYWAAPGRGRTTKANYSEGFRTYVQLDREDGRPVFDCGVKHELEIGDEVLALYFDALVFDLFGHAGRLVLWDRPQPSRAQARLFAAPAAAGLREAVGPDRARELSIWHLRSGRTWSFPVAVAIGALPEAEDAVRRAAGS